MRKHNLKHNSSWHPIYALEWRVLRLSDKYKVDVHSCQTYWLWFNLLLRITCCLKHGIFQHKNGCGGHLVFWNEAKIIPRHLLIGIKIFWKFDENTFINGWEIETFIKCDEWTHRRTDRRTHKRRAFYNLLSQAYQAVGDHMWRQTMQGIWAEDVLKTRNWKNRKPVAMATIVAGSS